MSIYVLVFTIIVVIVVALAIYGRGAKDREALQLYLRGLTHFFDELAAMKERYIPHAELLQFEKKWKAHYEDPISSKSIACKNETVQQFKDIYLHLKEYVINWNNDFVRREMQARRSWFATYDGRSLDEQQQKAVLTNEDNTLVVAGAGCGKTLTITAKIEYLVKVLGVDPNKILLLAFNRKAAQELTERLERKNLNVVAQTFHSLGLKIIVEAERMRPKVDDQDLLKKVIQEYIQRVPENSAECQKLLSFFGLYSYVLTDESTYRVVGEMYEHNRGFDFQSLKAIYEQKRRERQSLKGENMRSIEETVIANFLFLHGVEYEYERLYPYKGEDYRRNYTPDFYLPEYDIWLEHFGINRQGKTPWLKEIEGKRYVAEMQWKRNVHKQNNTKLIESYSYWKSEGKFIEKIDELLRTNGVVYKPIDSRDVYQTLYAQTDSNRSTIQEMQKLLHTFICLTKENSELTFEGLKQKATNLRYDMHTRTMQFLEIAQEISELYQRRLDEKKTIDFQDMISRATKAILQGRFSPEYQYIIVDEFQDISCGRYQLISAIRKASGALVYCVGDDWQSIYRFTGSDVGYLSNFEKYFGYSKVLKIERTYRNSQELIDVVGPFIMSNPNQIRKEMKSSKSEHTPVRIWLHGEEQALDSLAKCIDEIASDFGESSSVLLLVRNNFDAQFLIDAEGWIRDENSIQCVKHPNMNITLSTVHSAKGSEADNVILLGASNSLTGFPNKMADDPIMALVLSDGDNYSYAEERRLFYVAMTRTRHRIYVLVDKNRPSEFIRDIYQKNSPNIKAFSHGLKQVKNPICPRCQRGVLVLKVREDDKKPFVGCSLFPQCQNTYNDISILKQPNNCPKCGGFLLVREGTYGSFYGCSNYAYGCTYTSQISTPLH